VLRNILAAFTAATVLMFPGVASAAPKPVVSVGSELEAIAHATGKADAPENTIQGIAKAASKGAKWVEIDIRWNKSNFAIAMHNPDVDATTDGTGLLNTFWLPDVADLDAASYGQWDDKKSDGTWVYPQYHGTYVGSNNDVKAKVHPPFSWEFLNAAQQANVNLLLDVKETPTAEQAAGFYKYISDFGYQNRVIWQAEAASIKAMKSYGYNDLTYYLFENLASGTMRTAEYVKSLGASGLTVNWPNITPAFVAYYHAPQNNLQVFTWTTNNAADDVPATWQKLEDAGVDAIITDQHDDLRATLP
jgi:glycerophosphoryl diester phosphodiesterase